MTLGELLSQLLGWLGNFVEFLISFVPKIVIVRWNEAGVRFPGGGEPTALMRGVHWYWPWLTKVTVHEVTRFTLPIDPIPLETEDGIAVEVGMVVTYRITNVVVYDVENYHPDDNIRETAEGELCTIVKSHTWTDLADPAAEGGRLESKLKRRMQEALGKYGITVEGCRPNAQIRLNGAHHLFGVREVAKPA